MIDLNHACTSRVHDAASVRGHAHLSWRLAVGIGMLLVAVSPDRATAQDSGAAAISRANWSLYSVDSQEADFPASNAFDSDPSTIWSTEWVASAPLPPHDLQIDLGAVYSIDGFRALPRQDGVSYGRIADYELDISLDGVNWATAASGTWANTASEQQVLFPTTLGRYVRLRALSEVDGQPWTTLAELNVLADAGSSGAPSIPPPIAPPITPPSAPPLTAPLTAGQISQAGWTVQYVDSQETGAGGYRAINAIDGNPGSLWVTEWVAASPSTPHEIQIDLGAIYDVSGFRYLPRQDGLPFGRIAQYEFYVSLDAVTWGSAVAADIFPDTGAEQQVLFAAKPGRYVRLRALTEVNGAPWTAVAELNVLGAATATAPNQPPFVSLASLGADGPVPAPATLSLRATASDPDGSIARVDFYSGTTPLLSDSVPPYDLVLPNVGPGTYTLVATARDDSGNTTVSNPITLTVTAPFSRTVVFTASVDHDTVVRYLFNVFGAGQNPAQANPLTTLDLNKPPVLNGECVVDVSAVIATLPPGAYVATVSAVGIGGTSQSDPSAPFVR